MALIAATHGGLSRLKTRNEHNDAFDVKTLSNDPNNKMVDIMLSLAINPENTAIAALQFPKPVGENKNAVFFPNDARSEASATAVKHSLLPTSSKDFKNHNAKLARSRTLPAFFINPPSLFEVCKIMFLHEGNL